MTLLVAQSKALCSHNRSLLTDTRYRIARSRRGLNRAWRIAGASDDERQKPARPRTPLHIERWDGGAIDPATAEYTVSFGGSKDGVGTILIGKCRGLDGLDTFLRGLGVPSSEIETALRVLAGQPRHEIPDVKLTRAALRRLRV